MATRRLGISRGENIDQVTEAVGAAVVADNIEITWDLAANVSKEDVIKALSIFEAYVMKLQWPAA